jgi:hypothetical protein
MHGFVNLAVAASFVHAGKIAPEEAIEVLEERSPEAFSFLEEGLEWRGRTLDGRELAAARRGFFRSFGSCSFHEPVVELEECGIL